MQQTSLVEIAAAERRHWLALYVLCVGMLMIVLDATIVNVALPSTSAGFDITRLHQALGDRPPIEFEALLS